MVKTRERYCPYCGNTQERYYSIETAAQMMDCSEQFFRNLVRDRRIGYVKLGRMVKIPRSELAKLVAFMPSIEDEVRNTLKKLQS